MKKFATVITAACLLSSCSTMNQSFQLGGAMGFAGGALATYSGHRAGGVTPDLGQMATGAGIGLGIGLLTSYLVHGAVEEERRRNAFDETELHFGDLPPSPFLIPKSQKQGGKR